MEGEEEEQWRDNCSICLDLLREGGGDEGGLLSTPCDHLFHRDCLWGWFSSGVPGDCCPLCKKKMRKTEPIPVTLQQLLERASRRSDGIDASARVYSENRDRRFQSASGSSGRHAASTSNSGNHSASSSSGSASWRPTSESGPSHGFPRFPSFFNQSRSGAQPTSHRQAPPPTTNCNTRPRHRNGANANTWSTTWNQFVHQNSGVTVQTTYRTVETIEVYQNGRRVYLESGNISDINQTDRYRVDDYGYWQLDNDN